MTSPFTYPAVSHVRQHGPRGYADYESYRPWLRCGRRLVELIGLHRSDQLPGGQIAPFDVKLISPGMITADQVLPRLDSRFAHLSPVELILQKAETALNRVEAGADSTLLKPDDV